MIVGLDSGSARDITLTGGKGSELAALVSRELPVPEGFVVTTDAFAAFGENFDLQLRLERLLRDASSFDEIAEKAEPLQEQIRGAELPSDVRAALATWLKHFEDRIGSECRWAVRSSAVAEDLEGASFAGQYDTVLGVRGIDEVARALLHCWASFLNPHALQYRRDRNISEYRAAVVVQRLVPADAAGVCFSVNPVDGNRDHVVINANYGLGESVVGGLATPDTFILDKQDRVILSSTIGSKEVMTALVDGGSAEEPVPDEKRGELCLTAHEAALVASLAIQIESQEARPVDIEWAIQDGQVYLLQSRPITTLPEAPAVSAPSSQPPEGWVPETNTPIDPRWPMYSNGNISEVLPGAITPLSWSFVGPVIEHSFRAQILSFGAMPEPGPEHRVLGFFYHRPYICISYLAEAAGKTPGLSPDTIYEEFVGKPEQHTPGFSRSDFSARGLRILGRVLATVSTRLRTLTKDAQKVTALVHTEKRESSADKLAAFTDAQLIDPLEFGEALVAPSVTHIWASTVGVTTFSILRKLTEQWLGDEGGALAASLVTGIGELPSANPAFGIYELADVVKDDKRVRALFESTPGNAALLEKIETAEGGGFTRLRVRLEDFLDQHGHRAVCEAEFRNPCWREDPTQVLAMIRNYLGEGVTPPSEIKKRQEDVRTKAEADALGRLSLLQRPIFTRVLKTARRYIALREQLKDVVVLRSDWARRRYHELAARLEAQGKLASRDDIFFLVWKEVRDLVHGELSADEAAKIISRRRRDFEWCLHLQVPKIQEGTPRTVSLEDFDAGSRIEGIGVCPGRIEGIARVVLDPRQDCRVEPGEILIAPVTDAGWTPLFINAAGLVVEVGGLLSHGSVVAREYGLPAVVGAAGATRRIRTGDRVLLDGAAGTVVLLD